MSQLAIICNGDQPHNLFPTFIMGEAAAALGDQVVIFFCPAGAPALVKRRCSHPLLLTCPACCSEDVG